MLFILWFWSKNLPPTEQFFSHGMICICILAKRRAHWRFELYGDDAGAFSYSIRFECQSQSDANDLPTRIPDWASVAEPYCGRRVDIAYPARLPLALQRDEATLRSRWHKPDLVNHTVRYWIVRLEIKRWLGREEFEIDLAACKSLD
jgi:hypothetical protein